MRVITFGCRLNHAESHVMAEAAEAAGLDHAVLVNSCAVTNEAERQLAQTLRKLRREQPARPIILTGCASTIRPEQYRDLADYIIPNASKTNLAHFRAVHAHLARKKDGSQGEKASQTDPANAPSVAAIPAAGTAFAGTAFAETAFAGTPAAGSPAGHMRAWLQVQQGCDHRCTFCAIPQGRGPSMSFAPEQILEQALHLIKRGHRDLVLTGVDLTSWQFRFGGEDWRLGRLVLYLLDRLPGFVRVRLSSLDPGEIDAELFELIASDQRLMPSIHLSLQSGDDLILKRMKRRHLREDVIMLCKRLKQRREELVFGADFITGFPTESDAMFEHTRKMVEACGLIRLHVFPYSPRIGTPAARIPNQIAPELRRHRARLLRKDAARNLAAYYASQHGKIVEIMLETATSGRSLDDSPVRLGEAVRSRVGSCLRVRIDGHDDQGLLATVQANQLQGTGMA
ncbi:MAG: radical SAM protein [Pseudomonadota bacterium]